MTTSSATTSTPSTKSEPGISIEDLYRLSVEQYHAIADAGILEEDDPVELLEGWLVCKYGPFSRGAWRIRPADDMSACEEELGLTLAWIWRLTVDQYHAMIDAGILTEDDPVELLGGWLIRKMTQKPAHPVAVEMIRDAFLALVGGRWSVRTQAPVTLPEGEPEPDVALVRGDRREYLQRHPGAADVVLAVEVADTSQPRDRGIKKQMYAQAGIPVYWIVDLTARRIEAYSEPSTADEPEYRRRQEYGSENTIPVLIEGVEVGQLAVRELLP